MSKFPESGSAAASASSRFLQDPFRNPEIPEAAALPHSGNYIRPRESTPTRPPPMRQATIANFAKSRSLSIASLSLGPRSSSLGTIPHHRKGALGIGHVVLLHLDVVVDERVGYVSGSDCDEQVLDN